jgi:hypothetical protein
MKNQELKNPELKNQELKNQEVKNQEVKNPYRSHLKSREQTPTLPRAEAT